MTGNNPLSNYLQEQLGSLGKEIAVYSTTLLASYIGMAIGSTEETIGDYVRKMTPSTLMTKFTTWIVQNCKGINPILASLLPAGAGQLGYKFG